MVMYNVIFFFETLFLMRIIPKDKFSTLYILLKDVIEYYFRKLKYFI